MDARLRTVPLFAGMSDADIERICRGVTDVGLAAGEVLFREGEDGDAAYVVASGEVEIVKDVGRRTTLLATRGAGDVIGEMALLQDEPRIATVRGRTSCVLLRIPREVMDEVLETSPSALRSVFATLLERTRETNARLRQNERMAQLGTLTAGIAHELNNPAAGARRAAEGLEPAVAALLDAVSAVAALGEDGAPVLATIGATPERRHLGAVERSDAEAEVEQWLERRGVPDAWRWSSQLVDAGLVQGPLDDAIGGLGPDGTRAAVRLLASAPVPRRLARDVADATRRISELVSRLKSHSHLDRAPLQLVDVTAGIEDSLALLGHKLKAVTVVRDHGEDVPRISAVPSELNQVWMNLLDNAADAVSQPPVDDPRITVRTRRSGQGVAVEVEDNGPGIPSDATARIFDAFFTTKPPGSGTGLGLNLSYEIVTFDHHGELTVQSRPGRTVFRVELPESAGSGVVR